MYGIHMSVCTYVLMLCVFPPPPCSCVHLTQSTYLYIYTCSANSPFSSCRTILVVLLSRRVLLADWYVLYVHVYSFVYLL